MGWQLTELRVDGTTADPNQRGKAPKHSGWQQQGAPFDPSSDRAGLVHQWSGTCALDIDDVDASTAWLGERGVEIAGLFADPWAVQLISGRGNHAKLLYSLPVARASKKIIEAKRNILDFRCIGNQDVLPPTIHMGTGKPYTWFNFNPLLGLPPLPAALDAIWAGLVTPATEGPVAPIVPTTAGMDEIAELLASLDPDMDYLKWIKVGMAVHAATKGQSLFLWDNWSRRGSKYKGIADLMSHWRSFDAAGGVGIETLLADKVADKNDFPLDEFTGPEDDTIIGKAQGILRSRLVYLTHQERWWPTYKTPAEHAFDHNSSDPMTADGVRNIFTRHMPIIETKTRAYHLDPIDLWRKIPDPKTAYGVGFYPGGKLIYDDPNDGRKYVNSYKPYYVEAIPPSAHARKMWDFLFERIDDDNYRRWLRQYFAYLLKTPGKRVTCAPLLYGRTGGTGKTTLLEQIPGLLFGKPNVELMSNDTLKSQFNDQVANTWFLVMDELKMAKLDRIDTSNKVKAWITGDTLPVHPKGGKPYKITNRLQIVATSNHSNAAHLDNGDRRWAVCEVRGPGFTEPECADLYEGFLKTDDAPGMLKSLVLEESLAGFSPTGRPPDTKGRRTMIVAGLGGWESRLTQLILAGDKPFHRDIIELDPVRDALVGTNAPNLMHIPSLLKDIGLDLTCLRHMTKGRLYAWRNGPQWRRVGYAEALKYLESGVRPFDGGTDDLPVAIQALAEDDYDPDSVDDLLGDLAHG
jgi:hypothetical protein